MILEHSEMKNQLVWDTGAEFVPQHCSNKPDRNKNLTDSGLPDGVWICKIIWCVLGSKSIFKKNHLISVQSQFLLTHMSYLYEHSLSSLYVRAGEGSTSPELWVLPSLLIIPLQLICVRVQFWIKWIICIGDYCTWHLCLDWWIVPCSPKLTWDFGNTEGTEGHLRYNLNKEVLFCCNFHYNYWDY